MDLTQLANLGEFIGGVAVLVTLIYLANEIRRSRTAAEATALDSLSAGLNHLNRDMYKDSELLDIFIRGSADPHGLERVERVRFLVFAQSWINHFVTVKRSRDRDALPDIEWRTYATGFSNLLNSPGGEWACEQAAIPPDVREALLEYRSNTSVALRSRSSSG